MAWVKLDDSMPMHPKCLAAGVDGFALDVAGIAYCNRFKTDGKIPEMSLPAVLPTLRNPAKVAAKLVGVGRWSKTDDGWEIHDYLDFQPTKEHQEDVSVKRAAAGKLGGEKSKRKAKGSEDAKANANPVPSRPVDEDKSSSFAAFNAQRAKDEVRRRIERGQSIGDVNAYARALIKSDDFNIESKRQWTHRDCERCGGSAWEDKYAPGTGGYKVECSAGVE